MGNVIIAMDEETEAIMRRLAKRKYGGKKGSLSKVVSEALHKYNQEDRQKHEEFFAKLRKGHDSGGYKMYKNRSEIYD